MKNTLIIEPDERKKKKPTTELATTTLYAYTTLPTTTLAVAATEASTPNGPLERLKNNLQKIRDWIGENAKGWKKNKKLHATVNR